MSDEPTLAGVLAARLPTDYSRRKFFRLLAAAGLTSPLVGGRWVGAAAAAGDSLSTPRKFMNSFYTLNNDYFNEMDQGATQAAAKLNITESREINNADVNVQKGHIENPQISASTGSRWSRRPKVQRSTSFGSSIAEFWRRIEMRQVEYDSIDPALKRYRTTDDRRGDSKVHRHRISEQNLARLEHFVHDVALQGDMGRNLELRDEAIELGIDHWVRQRFDRPYPDTVTLLERNGHEGVAS